MAIAGSGGWKPARKVKIGWNGEIKAIGYAQNKPPHKICMNMEEAARLLLAGKSVEIHYYANNMAKLHEILKCGQSP